MAGVNVQMGVSGIGQFKQNINTAKNSLKTLDAQLSLTEKQFQATGDKETYMQEKTELLKVKLEEQKAIASQAEQALAQMASNGVDKASKAYQDMQQQLLKAKADMLDTENQLSGVGEASDEAANGVSEMNAQLKRVGQGVAWENVTDGMSKITDGIEGAIKRAWKLGEAIVNATLGAGSWADEVKTTAAQYEITPEQLQRMRKTAQIIDTDAETILDAQDKLKKGREKGDKEAMGALAYLGVDPTGKSDLDVFWEAGEALASLGKEEDKVAYAQKLFGKSWRELLPLFTAGREEYDSTMESWSVVSDEALDGLGEMDDQYQKMQAEFETFKTELLSAFSGPLTEGMETITGLFKELNEYLQTPEGKAMLQQMGDTISTLISDLTKVDPEQVVSGLKSVIDGISGGLQWITTNKDTVIAAVEGIVAGWAAIKLTGGALEIMKLINGIKTLATGGVASSAASAGATAGTSFATGFTNAFVAAAPVIASMLGVTAVALTPALIAQGEAERKAEETRSQRMADAESLSGTDKAFLQASADALSLKRDANGNVQRNFLGQAWLGGQEGTIEDILMGLGNRSDLEKSRLHNMLNGSYSSWSGNSTWNELMALWNGEGMEAGRLDAILESVADAYDRMAQEADTNNDSAEKVDGAGEKIEGAAKDMSKIPEDTAAAVQKALNGSRVVIDGGALTAVVGQYMAGLVAQYVK